MRKVDITWWPQPKQLEVIRIAGLDGVLRGEPTRPPMCGVIGYGGSAGGGKSDAMLGVAMLAAWAHPGINVVFFRRTYPELDGPGGAIFRSREMFSSFAKYDQTRHMWSFPNGSVVKFAHCQSEGDVHRYQSQQFDIILIDEATHFTEYQVLYLKTRNRATVDGVVPFMMLCTNPGGVGHLWYRSWFVDKVPWGSVHSISKDGNVLGEHVFIRAKLSDNTILEERDPGYRARLEGQDEGIKRALLWGDWDVFEGQFFSDWQKDVQVIEPTEIPETWLRWGGLDWGFAAPFCHLWMARDRDSDETLVYREVYESGLTDPEQAMMIRDLTSPTERLRYTLADPSMWARKATGREILSTAQVYSEYGVELRKAENSRIAGWRRVRQMLKVDGKAGSKLKIFSTCHNLVRTLPAMVHDPTHVEDMADSPHDHAVDALRYGLSWKLITQREEPDVVQDMWAGSRRKSPPRVENRGSTAFATGPNTRRI